MSGEGKIDGNIQKRNCPPHNQKPTGYSNAKTHPNSTHVGLQNKKESKDII